MQGHQTQNPCGRREREVDLPSIGVEQSTRRLGSVTVKGTPVSGMAPSFAGCRRNEGLGRSDPSSVCESREGFVFA